MLGFATSSFQPSFVKDEDECTSEATNNCHGQGQGQGRDEGQGRGRCINTLGSYLCNCSNIVGYTESTDGKSCVGSYY